MKAVLLNYKNLKFYRLLPIFLLAVFAVSCKSKKRVSETALTSLSVRNVVDEHRKAFPDFETLATRVQLQYDDGKSKQRVSANIRMKKDEIIWITANVLGITVAKAMLTPDSVQIYESISRRSFEGDYRVLSNWLGIDIDFKQAQAIFLGQSVMELKANSLLYAISDNKYTLEPKFQHPLFKQHLAIYPSNFKVANYSLEQTDQNRIFTLSYADYDKVGEDYYPSQISIQSIDDKKILRLHIDTRKIDLNPKLSFPFKIPSGYKAIRLE